MNLTIAKRLGLLIAGALLGIAVLVAVFLETERSMILDERKLGLQQAVETAHGLITYYQNQVASGKLTEEDAKAQAMASVRLLRYSGNEYFFIGNNQAVTLMNAVNPKLDGTNNSELKDASGKFFMQELANVVRDNGSGFVSYFWPKAGENVPSQKITYAKGLRDWGWYVASGVYVDNVDVAIRKRIISAAVGALALAGVLLAVSIWIARGIVRQLGGEPSAAADISRRIAEGDLTVNIAIKPGDQSSLLFAMKTMRDSLSAMVSKVRGGSEGVATASAQIAQGNSDLSSRTESQASALQETAASMEQLGATVKQNADSARQANQLAQSASAVAVKGGEVVAQVVDTMKGINESSKRISDIISVIDGIAFQTNILALNAAVEAARAGEQGRGFAVVASEVRSLAGRSADAAKEIKGLIGTSVERVEQGTVLVDQAGATMTEVVGSIRRVTDIVGEISAASAEQSQGVSQIGEAVQQMDQATQQNAALVEEMAAAASSLNGQAHELVNTVAVFKLGQTYGQGTLAAPAQARVSVSSAEYKGLERRAIGVAKGPAAPTKTKAAAASTDAAPKAFATASGDGDWSSF